MVGSVTIARKSLFCITIFKIYKQDFSLKKSDVQKTDRASPEIMQKTSLEVKSCTPTMKFSGKNISIQFGGHLGAVYFQILMIFIFLRKIFAINKAKIAV